MMGTKLCEYLPVIGSRFSSRARSFEASCHSLVMVFGGGPANTAVSTVRKRNRTCRVLWRPTEGSAHEVQSTSGGYTGQDSQYELWYAAGRVKLSTGSMGSEGNVVGCIYQRRVSNDYPKSASMPCKGENNSRKSRSYVPAFFSSSERVFQSLF